MPPRKLLGTCPHCGEPVYEDQDPAFKAEGREDPAHEACAIEATDEIIGWIRRELSGLVE